jgi:hypothetical protein
MPPGWAVRPREWRTMDGAAMAAPRRAPTTAKARMVEKQQRSVSNRNERGINKISKNEENVEKESKKERKQNLSDNTQGKGMKWRKSLKERKERNKTIETRRS